MQDKDIWKTYVEKAELVFRNGVLPEIIGKCITKVTMMVPNFATARGKSLEKCTPVLVLSGY